jgi:hypothetical protein
MATGELQFDLSGDDQALFLAETDELLEDDRNGSRPVVAVHTSTRQVRLMLDVPALIAQAIRDNMTVAAQPLPFTALANAA